MRQKLIKDKVYADQLGQMILFDCWKSPIVSFDFEFTPLKKSLFYFSCDYFRDRPISETSFIFEPRFPFPPFFKLLVLEFAVWPSFCCVEVTPARPLIHFRTEGNVTLGLELASEVWHSLKMVLSLLVNYLSS
jgi:hypothetical protein